MYKIYHLPLIVFIFFLSCSDIFSQSENYIYKHIKIEDGLSQSTILGMVQDRLGYMWIGTADGLDRYDGYNIKVYSNNFSDSNSISNNTINTPFEDKYGNLWFGVLSGELNLYNRKNDNFIIYDVKKDADPKLLKLREEQLDYPMTTYGRTSSTAITSITEDNDGNLWVGTWGLGLFKYSLKNSKITFQGVINNVGNAKITKITKIIYYNKEIWVSTLGNGIFRINVNQNKTNNNYHYSIRNKSSNLLSDEILTLFISKNKVLYISTYQKGVQTLDLTKNQVTLLFKNHLVKSRITQLYLNNVMTIVQDNNNYIWFGTFGNGLFRISDDNFNGLTNYTHQQFNKESLIDNDILSLHVDKTNILWVGTHLGKGISRLIIGNIKFNLLQKESLSNIKLNDDVVWSVYEDKSKKLWIGTYRGGINVYYQKNNIISYLTKENSRINDNHIRSIDEDSFGNIWIGTYSGGLNIYNIKTKKISIYKNNPTDTTSIGANQILDILMDSDSIVWLGTYGGGLNKCTIHKNSFYKKIEFKKYIHSSKKNSISDDRVYKIFKAKDGKLLIGTYGGGFNIFDPITENFISYQNNPNDIHSLSDNRVLSVIQNSIGDIWVGTFGGNLNKFDLRKGQFIRYDQNNGLNGNVIYGILEDDLGNFWLSTDNGIIKYNYSTQIVTYFDVNDGLQSLEYSGGAYLKTKTGQMYFGGVLGLNYFYPDSIRENINIPSVVISSIKIFDRKIDGYKSNLYLDYDQNYLTFEFTALDFTNPDKNQYLYKLENFNQSWIMTDSKHRIATYTNLPPGKYTFRVLGSNNDGLWNEKGVSIEIIIYSPFWEKWWFILLALMTIILIIFSIIYTRFQSILAVERLKAKLAADLHDNVGSGLTEISILSELISAKLPYISDDIKLNLGKISETARHLVDTMSDIVWVVNPQKDALHDLIIRLRDSYGDIYSFKGISFKTQNIDKLSNIKLTMEYKQHLFLILKEALNNSLKHSNCSKIILDVAIKNGILTIILSDNGKGIDNFNFLHGNGIRNMKYRAQLIDGNLVWNSSEINGTSIIFSCKIGNGIKYIRKFIN
ncbi:MAG: two-component regulator propeller domain-containing protein [bacterium]